MFTRPTMFSNSLAVAFVCLGLVVIQSAEAAELQSMASKYEAVPAEAAPEQLSHFAPLIGRWSIEDWGKDKEGNWVESSGADWDFWYALDGWAVEDKWVKPGNDVEIEDPTKRFIGLNVRVWDKAAEKWKMAWIHTYPGAPQFWEATSTAEVIEMELIPPGEEQSTRRIKFYNMTGDHFDWMSYVRGEDGEWTETYKIRGTRKT